jgi:hypothetical protein
VDFFPPARPFHHGFARVGLRAGAKRRPVGAILIVLLSLLVATGVVIYLGWTLANGTDVPTSGYAAMAFGVIISLAVGFGLIARHPVFHQGALHHNSSRPRDLADSDRRKNPV